jgi:hypothetical protein
MRKGSADCILDEVDSSLDDNACRRDAEPEVGFVVLFKIGELLRDASERLSFPDMMITVGRPIIEKRRGRNL